MFEGMFTEYEDKLKVAAANVGNTAAAYAERIIARLDAIHEAVTDPEFDNRTEDYEQAITAAAPATFQVPPGEAWELTYLATDIDTVVTIAHGSRLRGRWDTAKPPQAPGLLLRGGSEFTVTVGADAYVYAQFKVRKPVIGRTTKNTGMEALTPDGTNTVDENVGRHGPGAVTRRAVPKGDTPAGGVPGV